MEKTVLLLFLPFLKSLVVDSPDGIPYLRVRLEATWEKSSNVEGAIESRIYYITCPEGEKITEEFKVLQIEKIWIEFE